MRRSLRWLRILAALLGIAFAAGLVLAASASAHATLVASDPVDGSRLKSAPAAVTLTFDEPVTLGSLGYLHVTDQTGRRVDAGNATHPDGDSSKVTDTLKASLGDGTYTASFRIVSADSHPVAGVIRFVVGNGVLSASSVDLSTVNHTTSKVFDAVRWVSFAGVALLGGVWLLLTVFPQGRDDRRARQLVWAGWGLGASGAVGELLLQGPYAAGEGLSAITNWSLLDGTLHTDYGQFHSARLLLFGALALLLGSAFARLERSRVDDVAWPLLLGVAYTFAATGHAATTSPHWLSELSDIVHIGAMSAWIGGLAMVVGVLLPRRERDEMRAALPVFSRVAFGSACLLAVTGGYQAWRGVGSLHAILHTNYGLLVSAKVLLFAGLLALGNLSRVTIRRRLLPPVVAYAMTDAPTDTTLHTAFDQPPQLDDAEHERMRRSILVELVLAALVLAATAVLVDQPRGKEVLAVANRKPITTSAPLGGGQSVAVTVEPGVHGPVTVALALSPGTKAIQVSASATQPAKQLGPIPIKLAPNGTDLYGASGVNLPVSGRWVFAVVVTYSQFDAVTADVSINLH